MLIVHHFGVKEFIYLKIFLQFIFKLKIFLQNF